MTVDELFLLTLLDLEQRLELGRGEYDALNMASLLRKLLLDDVPLVHAVNRSRRLRLRFRVNDVSPPLGGVDWAPYDTFYPDPCWSDITPVDLTLDQLLARPVLVAFGQVISVRDLIKFLANHYGAVHTTPADDAKTRRSATKRGRRG